jgi:cytochrome c oxidase assembly protein subunit 15
MHSSSDTIAADSPVPPDLTGLHRFAMLVVVATLFLIVAGGLVTSTGSGLAVPDWPLANGQVFPKMEGGVLFEHGHRMVATAIGILTIILAVWIWRRDPRRWMRTLGLVALGAVIAQGLLGGLTVLFLLPTPISVAHACLGQIFFCAVVAIAVFTGRGWLEAPPPVADRGRPGLRALTAATSIVVFLQLLLGAIMRHTASGLAIPDFPLAFGGLVPPSFDTGIAIHYAHRIGALAVTIVIVGTVWRVFRAHGNQGALVGPAATLAGLLPIQILLGGITVLSMKAVTPTTAHVAVGALILGISVVLALRAARLLGAAEREPAGGISRPAEQAAG